MNRFLLPCLFSLLLFLGACGIKGPLYLPEQDSPNPEVPVEKAE